MLLNSDIFLFFKIIVIIFLVIAIMILRFKIFTLVYPLISQIAKSRPLLETKELTKGINFLQNAVGIALIAILLLIFEYDVFRPSLFFDLAVIVLLILIAALGCLAIQSINQAFMLEEHVKSPRKYKMR